MEITISARKVNLKDNFKERVDTKLKKFNRIFSDEATAKVTVTVNKNSQTVEVTVFDKGMIYRAEASCTQMNDALDKVVDLLGRQIRKHKSKLSKKIKEASIADLIAELDAENYVDQASADDEYDEYDLVRVKNFSLAPMSVQEAILQMNMVGHKFFMFKNSDNDKVNVIYVRKDGTYGLLDPKD